MKVPRALLAGPEAQAADLAGDPGSAAAPPSAATLAQALAPLVQRGFLALCACCALLAVFTVSDGLVYVGLQRGDLVPAAWMPTLFVGSAAVFMVAAVPVGRLADRVGPIRVFVAGQVGLALMYGLLGLDVLPADAALAAVVLLTGLYYAATDGVVMAFVAGPASVRTVRRPPTPERAWVEDAASPAVLRGGPVPSPGAARASAARP